jgi:hypothetical protein
MVKKRILTWGSPLAAAMCCAFLMFPLLAAAQSSLLTETEVEPGEIPFDEWAAAGVREEIPWRVQVARPRLSISQRHMLRMTILLDGKKVGRSGASHFVVVAALRQAEGVWLENRGMLGVKVEAPPPKGTQIEIVLQAFVLPGKYTLGLLLYDRQQRKRSMTFREVRVSPISRDPLPDSARGLPRVEFIQSERAFLRSEPMEITTKLFLPVETRRPVNLDVLVNYTPSYEYSGRRGPQQQIISVMTGMLRVFSQLDLRNGTLNLTALDLARQRTFFEQRNVRDLDYPGLREALPSIHQASVDVKDLERRFEMVAYFRHVLSKKLAPLRPMAGAEAGYGNHVLAAPPEDPYRVVIVVSAPMLFERRTDLQALPAPANCNCRVYHLRYRLGRGNDFDQLYRAMEKVRPKLFEIETPEQFRKVLARIIADLRAL